MPIPYNGIWEDKDKFLLHFDVVEKFCHAHAYKGSSHCRLCSINCNGSYDYYTDVFVWPSGFRHYIVDHNVKPSDKFIRYILAVAPIVVDFQREQEG